MKKLLLIEDHHDIRDQLHLYLTHQGYACLMASDGADYLIKPFTTDKPQAAGISGSSRPEGVIGAFMQFGRNQYEQQWAGLAIVTRLLWLHDGEIHIESKPNMETLVQVTLPLTGQKDVLS